MGVEGIKVKGKNNWEELIRAGENGLGTETDLMKEKSKEDKLYLHLLRHKSGFPPCDAD